MIRNLKLPAAFIACLLLVIVWGQLLAVMGMGGFLFLAYLMSGFFLSSLFYSRSRTPIQYACLSVGFGLFVGVIDISLAAFAVPELALLSLADMAVKAAFSAAGGLLFFLASRPYHSGRRLLKTDAGTLSRRIVAALVDCNIMLLLILLLSLMSLPFPSLSTTTFIVSVETTVIFCYKAIYEAVDRKTIGKKLTGIEVRGRPWQALLRNSILILFGISMFPQVAGSWAVNIIYLLMAADLVLFFTGRRLFDIIAMTSVVRPSPLQVRGRPEIKFSFR